MEAANLDCLVEERTLRDDVDVVACLREETSAEVAWRQFWSTLNFTPHTELTPERVKILREKIIPTLQGLGKDDYSHFCELAHEYTHLHREKVGEVFPHLPKKEDVRRVYQGQLDSLDQRVQNIRKWDRKIPLVIGALTFVGGAIGAGNLGDYFLDNQQLPYVFAAVGGVLGYLVGDGVTTLGFEAYGSGIHKQKKKVREDITNVFAARVEEYIRQNS